ncbi:neuronal acetylcholine receptor subunit alpha-7-like [Haliotis rufescens]|uniref:neuronal acetylcholine receptor subunit alpha-7-like n=1 Tax=Haliotis rufescens TaxID=6454 RepID=UPI00201F9839|nr:neuronal acetylcholine receptor subunit alpha-7-like [Haliotis rufescens]
MREDIWIHLVATLLAITGVGDCVDDYILQQKLYSDIIESNNPNIRPVRNKTHVTRVSITFNLVAITEFDEVSEALASTGYMEVTWDDEILTWNPTLYGGVKDIRPAFDQVWKPRVAVQNTVDKMKPLGLDFGILVLFFTGSLTWYPGDSFKTSCKMDVTKFPFDVQTCSFNVFVWADTINTVDLFPVDNFIGLDIYNVNSEWDITNTSATRHTQFVSFFEIAHITYQLQLTRKPSMKILTVVMPVLLLSFLNILVFLIPVQSGEKLSFSITVLLSFAVFMSFITNMLPQSADSLSVFTLLMAGLFLLSSLYVLLTIWVIKVFHRDSSKRAVPLWVHRLMGGQKGCCGSIRIHTAGGQDVSDISPSGYIEKSTRGSERLPRREVQWKRVSEAMDKFFFWLFLLLVVSLMAVTVFKIYK